MAQPGERGLRGGYDVVVVGLGVMGSSALWQCSRHAGVSCLGLEQFSTPHVLGSSHGASRITRTVYPEPHFAKLAKRAWTLWEELENDSGTELIVKTGGLDWAPEGSANARKIIDTCESLAIPFDKLDARDVVDRYPGLTLPNDYVAVATAQAGVIKASKSVETLKNQARKQGATIRDEIRLYRVTQDRGDIQIELEDMRVGRGNQRFSIKCKKLIVCPGAWLSPLVQSLFQLNVPTQVHQMGYFYFKTTGDDPLRYHASKFPVFIDYTETEHAIYGTPSYEYPDLLKVGCHGPGFTTTHIAKAENRTFTMIPALREYTQSRVQRYFPYADWKAPVHSETCLYTVTRQHEFLLDQVPGQPNIVVGGGGSGHAFKHGAAIGERLCRLALGPTLEDKDEYENFSFDYHLRHTSHL